MKFLLIRLGGAEEILFATPIIRTLKTQHPEADVGFLTLAEHSFLLEANPYLQQIFTTESEGLNSRIKEYTHIIDLEGSSASKKLYKNSIASIYSFDSLRWANWLLTTFQKNKLPNKHLTNRFYDVVAPLGIQADALGLDYFIPEKDQVPPAWLPELPANNYVVFSLSAMYATRQLPLNRMIELCDKINKIVLLLGKPEDVAKGEAITNFFNRLPHSEFEEGLHQLGKRTKIINGCGKFNFHQQASLIKGARYVFCHDSPHLAVASAFQKKIFSLWGNTIPEMGKYPYRTNFVLFEKKGLSCRPCSTNGYKDCPKKHLKCLNGITFDFYLP